VIRQYLTLLALRALARLLGRLTKIAVQAAVVLAAAPVVIVAAYSAALAWLLGWPPRRLYTAALWCTPMLAVWLAATALRHPSASRVATAPFRAWLTMWQLAASGHVGAAIVTVAPAALPFGMIIGGIAWSYRIYSMETGSGGFSPASPVAFDLRQWRHQVRTARARIAAPGSVPLIGPNGSVVAGAVIRAVQHPARTIACIPYDRLRSHQVVIGTTGTGKTTLLLRLWAGFMTTALRRYAHGAGHRPLLVVLDCKGGADSRRIADRARRVLRDAGARGTAIWPDEASLSLWDLPPDRLTTTLLDLIEHGTGSAAYYADVMDAVVALAVGAPCGPPAGSAEFVARLDAGWLATAYASGGHEAELGIIHSASRLVTDVALRYRTLLRRLGTGLDGPGGFGDADAWYCILEGTAEPAVAEAQARALVDMLACYAAGGGGQRPAQRQPGGTTLRAPPDPPAREILLAVDEFSAVSRRLPIWQLYERARSLGLAVQVSAQSWQGLAADEDERYRIAATAEGGIWLLRTPYPDPVAGLAGTRRIVDTARRLLGAPLWSEEGSSRVRHAQVLDPAIVRALDVGQAAYVHRGGVTFVQVKRLVAGPAALPSPVAAATGQLAAPPAAVPRPAAPADALPPDAGPSGARPPDAGALLDEAFGKESR